MTFCSGKVQSACCWFLHSAGMLLTLTRTPEWCIYLVFSLRWKRFEERMTRFLFLDLRAQCLVIPTSNQNV